MTNFEKYKDELLGDFIEKATDNIGVTPTGELGYCSIDIDCHNCIFGKRSGYCAIEFIKWLYEEYEKPIILDDFTKELLKRYYNNGYTHIAKNSYDDVCVYSSVPKKRNGEWRSYDENVLGIDSIIATFDFLSWEDEEATVIKDLIIGDDV